MSTQPYDGGTGSFEAAARESHPERGPTLGHSPAFVGRREELEHLYNALRDTVNLSRLHRVSIVGEAGAGKTRLVDEFFDIIEPGVRNLTVIRAVLGPDGEGPLGVLASLLRAWVGLDPREAESEARARIADRLAAALGTAAAEQVRLLEALLGLGSARVALAPNLDAAEYERRVVALGVSVLRTEAARRPLVLVIDRLRWVGDSDATALGRFFELAHDLPVLVVLLSRRPLPASLLGAVDQRQIPLGPLGAREVERLARNVLEPVEGTTEAIVRIVVEKSGGLPGLLLDVVRVMTLRGVLAYDPAAESWTARPQRLGKAPLPGTAGESSLLRISELSAKERGILEKAAVIGETFWLSGVLLLMRTESEADPERFWVEDVKQLRLNKVMLELQARGLVSYFPETVLAGDPEFGLRSGMDREALLAGIPDARLALYRRIAGRWMLAARPATLLPRWYRGAGELLQAGFDRAGAADAFLSGAAAAHEAMLGGLGMDLCRRGIELLDVDDAPRLLELHARMAELCFTEKAWEGAAGHLRSALRMTVIVGDQARGARTYLRLGEVLLLQGEAASAREALELAVRLAEAAGEPVWVTEAQRVLKETATRRPQPRIRRDNLPK